MEVELKRNFLCSKVCFFLNGNLDSLNSKSFARILDHKLSQFIGIIDWQSQSLNLIAYFDNHEENFWRGHQLQITLKFLFASK